MGILYSRNKAEEILRRHQSCLRSIEASTGVPRACLEAVILQEMLGMDGLDLCADLAVRCYWFRCRVRRRLCRKGLLRSPLPRFTFGPLGKRDSSTGYAQVFAHTGLDSLRFARSRGIPLPPAWKEPDDPLEALERMWKLLHGRIDFNFYMAALTLLSAAEEMTGSTDFSRFSPEEMALIFSRYNADTRRVTTYGQAVLHAYLSRVSRSDRPSAAL